MTFSWIMSGLIIIAMVITPCSARAEDEHSLLELQSLYPLDEFYEPGEMGSWLQAISQAEGAEIRKFLLKTCDQGYLYENQFLLVFSLQRLAEALEEQEKEPMDMMLLANMECSLARSRYTTTLHAVVLKVLAFTHPEALLEWAISNQATSTQEILRYNEALRLLSTHLPPQDLLAIIDTFTDQDPRRNVIETVFRSWAVQDPVSAYAELSQRLQDLNDAEISVNQLEPTDEDDIELQRRYGQKAIYESSINHILEVLASADSDVPIESLDGVLAESQVTRLKSLRLERLARSDPRSAFDIFNSTANLTKPDFNNDLFSGQNYEIYHALLQNWVRNDAEDMLAYIRAKDSSQDGHLTTMAFGYMVNNMARNAPLEAMDRVTSLDIPESEKHELYSSVLGVWFFSDTESALQWLESNRDREKYNGFFARISAQMPVRGPSGTADFDVTRRIYELLSVERQNQAIDTILEYLLHIPLLDADSWVDSLQNEEGRNIAIDHLAGMRIKLLADTDPLQALYQAGDFYGSNAGLIRRHVFHYALGSNPEQAMAWLADAGISDDERAHLKAEATGRGIHTSVTD